MEDLLKYVLEKLCEKPESISIDRKDDEEGFVTFNVDLAEEDKGKVIGKGGQNIKAIRSLLSILGIKENKRVMVKIN